jgi:sortase (surface protein transpeptidase)
MILAKSYFQKLLKFKEHSMLILPNIFQIFDYEVDNWKQNDPMTFSQNDFVWK